MTCGEDGKNRSQAKEQACADINKIFPVMTYKAGQTYNASNK